MYARERSEENSQNLKNVKQQRSLKSKLFRKRALYLSVGCCFTFHCILVINYLVSGWSTAFTIPVLKHVVKHEANDLGKSNAQEDVALSSVPKTNPRPDPGNPNPSDWDLVFIERPRLEFEAWTKDFESCFFEQRMTNEVTFWAKYY